MVLEVDKVVTNKFIQIKTCGFNTATINAIRRTMILYVECYGFDEFMDDDDYALVTKSKKEHRHVVLTNTTKCQAIPVMAHRCSRIPIQITEDNDALLESTENRKVFFVYCQKPTGEETWHDTMAKPFVLKDDLIFRIYARDLTPVVLKRNSSDDEFVYNAEDSEEISKVIDTVFPYNTLVIQLGFNDKFNVILKPIKGIGIDNARWIPCTFKYRFRMDPKWLEQNEHLISSTGDVRRKIHDRKSLRDLFTIDPTTGDKYNMFGKPYGHDLIFLYNGKMDHIAAFNKSVQLLIDKVYDFLKYYKTPSLSTIYKDISYMSNDDDRSVMETLYIPKNTEDLMSQDKWILCDHTMGNLITSKMLEIVASYITDASGGLDLWRQINISYKIPHPNIRQCVINIKLPSDLRTGQGSSLTHAELVEQTVKEIVEDLRKLLAA
jgi:hypothetical protein